MGVRIEQLEEILSGLDLKHMKVDESKIILGINMDGEMLKMVIALQEDGEHVGINAINMATCERSHPAFDRVIEFLARANYQYKVGKLEWDPSDGEIRASASISLEDNTELTESQFRRLMSGVMTMAQKALPEIKSLLNGASGPKRASSSSRKKKEPVVSRRKSETDSEKKQSNISGVLFGLAAILFGAATFLAVLFKFVLN